MKKMKLLDLGAFELHAGLGSEERFAGVGARRGSVEAEEKSAAAACRRANAFEEMRVTPRVVNMLATARSKEFCAEKPSHVIFLQVPLVQLNL